MHPRNLKWKVEKAKPMWLQACRVRRKWMKTQSIPGYCTDISAFFFSFACVCVHWGADEGSSQHTHICRIGNTTVIYTVTGTCLVHVLHNKQGKITAETLILFCQKNETCIFFRHSRLKSESEICRCRVYPKQLSQQSNSRWNAHLFLARSDCRLSLCHWENFLS